MGLPFTPEDDPECFSRRAWVKIPRTLPRPGGLASATRESDEDLQHLTEGAQLGRLKLRSDHGSHNHIPARRWDWGGYISWTKVVLWTHLALSPTFGDSLRHMPMPALPRRQWSVTARCTPAECGPTQGRAVEAEGEVDVWLLIYFYIYILNRSSRGS